MSKRDRLAVVGIMLIVLLFFFRASFLQGAFFIGDTSHGYVPRLSFNAAEVAAGRLPLWNPFVSLGGPQIADPAAMALYPPALLLFGLLPGFAAYNYMLIGHILLAALSTFAFARLIGVGTWGAMLAGITYALGGWALTHIEHINVYIAAAYLPILFIIVEYGFQKGGWRWFAAGTLTLGMYFLGAHPQMPLFAIVGLSAYAVMSVLYLWRAERTWHSLVPRFGAFAAMGVLGAGLAALQLVPMAQTVSLSSRSGGVGADIALGYSYPPEQMLTLVAPYLFGDPNGTGDWGRGIFREMAAYIGIGPLLLAAVGVTQLRRNRFAAAFVLGLVLAILLSMGRYTPLYRVLATLPLFDLVRYPSRFLFVAAFSLSMLAGLGLDAVLARRAAWQRYARPLWAAALAWTLVLLAVNLALEQGSNSVGLISRLLSLYGQAKHPPEWYYDLVVSNIGLSHLPGLGLLVFGAFALVLLALFLRGRLAGEWFAGATVAWAAIDLFVFGAGLPYTQTASPSLYSAVPETVRVLQADTSLYRIYYWAADDTAYLDKVQPGLQNGNYGPYLTLLREGLRGSFNVLFGIPSLTGYATEDSRHFDVLRKVGGVPAYDLGAKDLYHHPLDIKLLSLLNGKYITTMDELNDPQMTLVYRGDLVHLYRNESVLPRAFIASQFEVHTNGTEILTRMDAADVDLKQVALLEQDPGWKGSANSAGSVRITQYLHDRVELEADLTAPGILVLSDMYYPGWRVEVDGLPQPVLRTDYILRGVALLPGAHKVRFTYVPEAFSLGLAVSAASLLLTLVSSLAAFYLTKSRMRHTMPDRYGPERGSNSLAHLSDRHAPDPLSAGQEQDWERRTDHPDVRPPVP